MASQLYKRSIPYLIYFFCASIGAYAAVSLYKIITSIAPDFAQYYQAVTETSIIANQPNLLPPVSRLVYWPIGFLPYQFSQAVWVGCSLIALWIAVRVILRLLGNHSERDVLLYTSCAFLTFPVRFTLGMGQVNLIALALLMLSIREEVHDRSVYGGILLTVAMLFKPELVLLYAFFILARRWQFCLVNLLTAVCAVGISIGWWGIDSYRIYATRMGLEFGILQGRAIYYNQSLSGVLARISSDPRMVFVYIALTVVILGIFFWAAREKYKQFPSLLWAGLPLFLIVEPIAWQHHLIFLLPTYLWLWQKIKMKRDTRLDILFWLSVIFVSWNIKNPLYLQQSLVGNIVLSHGFWGMMLASILSLRLL